MSDYGIYQKMERLYHQHGLKVCVDSAFKMGDREFLIKSSQQDAATSLRQLSEHGMRLVPVVGGPKYGQFNHARAFWYSSNGRNFAQRIQPTQPFCFFIQLMDIEP